MPTVDLEADRCPSDTSQAAYRQVARAAWK